VKRAKDNKTEEKREKNCTQHPEGLAQKKQGNASTKLLWGKREEKDLAFPAKLL